MIKRTFFTLLATILLSFSAFAQNFGGGDGTSGNPYLISTKVHFLAISDLSKHYIQTADIVLEDRGNQSNAIINGTFSGTYDGDGYSISYSANFTESNGGLFKEVTGEVKDLNIVNSYATVSGTNANIGLICGTLSNKGVIRNCHVMGDINSKAVTNNNNSNTGLIVGKCNEGIIHSCSAIGNISGVGNAGGIAGYSEGNDIVRGCSFVGAVRAIKPNNATAYAGGIVGFTKAFKTTQEWTWQGLVTREEDLSPKIYLCYVNAEIIGENARAITTTNKPNNVTVENCFAKGNVKTTTESVIDIADEIANANNVSYLTESATTRSALNTAISEDDITNDTDNSNNNDYGKFYFDNEFYFSIETGGMVLVYGKISTCDPPSFTTEFTHTYGSFDNGHDNFIITFEEEGTYEWDVRKLSSHYPDGDIREQGIKVVNFEDNIPDTIRTNIATQQADASNGNIKFRARRICDDGYTNYVYESFYLDSRNNIRYDEGKPDCKAVAPLTLGETTPTTAEINLDLPDNSLGYRYKINDGNYTVVNDGNATLLSLTNLTPNTIYRIDVESKCSNTEYSVERIIEFSLREDPPHKTVKNGEFNDPTIWNTNSVPDGANRDITIKHDVILSHTLTLSGTTTLAIEDGDETGTEKARLHISQQGQLINMTNNDILGIVEIKPSINEQNKWEFIGAPFMTTDNIKKYRLETIVPVRGSDVVVSLYNDEGQVWITNPYANYTSIVETGKGYFGYPYYTGAVTFTTYGDLWDFSLNGGTGGMKEYDETDAKYKLNKADVKVGGEIGGFLPLSNPYPAKLSIEKFLSQNSSLIQGEGVYRYNNNSQSFDMNPDATGDIDIAEGFFVKLASGVSSIDFRQTQLTEYPVQGKKSQTAEREFVELSLTADNHSSKLYFAHNEQAEQGYDIFDADKLFAMTEMTEPYFLTQGISLVKEEVNTLPYYATMNVRSYENKEVSFKANNIPQGIAVSLIDGEETIELNEGVVYTTNVSSGENANRFKVLFSQSVGLNDVEELEVNITNDNRLVNITTSEKDLQIEVYNALGQRVFATKDFNFSLNNVSAGAYMIKAFNNKASKTQKIIIK